MSYNRGQSPGTPNKNHSFILFSPIRLKRPLIFILICRHCINTLPIDKTFPYSYKIHSGRKRFPDANMCGEGHEMSFSAENLTTSSLSKLLNGYPHPEYPHTPNEYPLQWDMLTSKMKRRSHRSQSKMHSPFWLEKHIGITIPVKALLTSPPNQQHAWILHSQFTKTEYSNISKSPLPSRTNLSNLPNPFISVNWEYSQENSHILKKPIWSLKLNVYVTRNKG